MTQIEYITLLFAELGFDTVTQRKGFLRKWFGKDHADELSSAERSRAINMLKDQKTSRQ